MATPQASTREFNMAKRRQRILHEARQLITRGGYDALNLRTLAAAAGVTVPTIYNLVGNKETLVIALFTGAMHEIEKRVGSHGDDAPLAQAEAVVTESIGVFAEDEAFYRAAFIAVEVLDQTSTEHDRVAGIYRWGARMITAGCNACERAGLLRGCVPVALLGEHMLRTYRTSCRAWAFGRLTIDEFETTALTDIYLGLASDAVETFHAQLSKKLTALRNADPLRPNFATAAKE